MHTETSVLQMLRVLPGREGNDLRSEKGDLPAHDGGLPGQG